MNAGAAALLACRCTSGTSPRTRSSRAGREPDHVVPDVLVWGLLLVLELVGAVIKPFALMIRLFANMIAGHIVLAALIC
jgi:hypothetical protein